MPRITKTFEVSWLSLDSWSETYVGTKWLLDNVLPNNIHEMEPEHGPRTTYKYSEEFKATAVRLSHLPGVAVKDVAQSLYIHPFMLSRWRKQVREGLIMAKGQDIDKEVAAELKELREMKKNYLRLQEEHDLLKK